MDTVTSRRYQIFISSTFTDLIHERRAAYDAVLSLRHIPVGMEYFPAAPVPPWELIKSLIDDSDYYVLIIAGRYGSMNEEGVSFTEAEYDYAVNSRKPVLAFMHQLPAEISRAKTDGTEHAWQKLEAFRQKVLLKSTCSLWANVDDLRAKLLFSLLTVMSSRPARGWVRPIEENLPSGDTVRLSMLRSAKPISEVIERSILNKIDKQQSLLEQLPTGIGELDSIIGGGLLAGSIVIAGARPNTGLTTLLINVAIAIAKKDLPVLIFTTRRNMEEYTRRVISCLSGTNIANFDNSISDESATLFANAVLEMSKMEFYLDNNCAHTFDTFAERCRMQAKLCGALPLIIIDSLQFIGFVDASKIGILLKNLAIELNSIIIVGVTLGRNVDLRPNRVPLLSDVMPENINDIADIVFFATRPSNLFSAESAQDTIELVVARNSNGPISAASVACNFVTGRIFSIPKTDMKVDDDF